MTAMSRREMNDLIARLADQEIDSSVSEFDINDLEDHVSARVAFEIAGSDSRTDLVRALVGEKVRKHVRRRSIEKADTETRREDMFYDGLMGTVVMIDDSTAIRYENATIPILEAAQARREENTKKQIAATELGRERLDAIREALNNDPTMTVRDAMIVIKGRPHKAA